MIKEEIKLQFYNDIKEAIGGNYGFFSVGFDFGFNHSNQQTKPLIDKIEQLKFELKAADSVNEQLQSKIDEYKLLLNNLNNDL